LRRGSRVDALRRGSRVEVQHSTIWLVWEIKVVCPPRHQNGVLAEGRRNTRALNLAPKCPRSKDTISSLLLLQFSHEITDHPHRAPSAASVPPAAPMSGCRARAASPREGTPEARPAVVVTFGQMSTSAIDNDGAQRRCVCVGGGLAVKRLLTRHCG
jgi:hypothetical protein